MMAKLVYRLLVLSVLGAVLIETGAEVSIPFPVDSLLPSSGLNSMCEVRNESFIGWFKVKGNVKIDVVPSRSAVREKPGVVVRTISPHVKRSTLVIPAGSTVTAGGRYECKGDKNKASLEVQARFNLDSLQTNQSLPIGHSGQIILGALAYPFAKFSWKKDGVAIDFAANPRLTLENDGSITFSKVRVSDAGVYEANVNWESRNFADKTVIAHVVAPTPPIITSPLKNQTVTKGDPIRLLCNVTGIPAPRVSWSKANGNINPSYVSGNVLRIPRAEVSDAGKYICTARNDVSTSTAEAFVRVKFAPTPPIITSPPKNQTVTKGDPIRLLCNATGIPAPGVSWSKADGNINFSYVSGNVLMIPRAEVSDAGKYICTARNNVSTTTAEAFVRVKLQPHSPLPLSAQLTHLAIKIYWKEPESHGYPVLMYSVHKVELDQAGQEVTSRTYHVNEDVHHYKVTGIKGGNTYKFFVTAWNTHGESMKNQSKSVTVKVQKP